MKRNLLAFLALTVASASAATYNLDALVNGSATGTVCSAAQITNGTGTGCLTADHMGFVIGDKIFTFEGDTLTTGPVGSTPTTTAGFTITTLHNGNLYGFGINGLIQAQAFPGQSAFTDLALLYTVATTNGAALIDSLHANVNGFCIGVVNPGLQSCSATASETATDINANNLLPVNPLQASLGDPGAETFLHPVNFVQIGKDIALTATNNDPGTGAVIANLSIIQQYVDQAVPEPALFGVLALGMGGLGFLARKRRTSLEQ